MVDLKLITLRRRDISVPAPIPNSPHTAPNRRNHPLSRALRPLVAPAPATHLLRRFVPPNHARDQRTSSHARMRAIASRLALAASLP